MVLLPTLGGPILRVLYQRNELIVPPPPPRKRPHSPVGLVVCAGDPFPAQSITDASQVRGGGA